MIVTARDEQERIGTTLAALGDAFPGAAIVVADDGSRDRTALVARSQGADVLGGRRLGKGAAATRAASDVLARVRGGEPGGIVLLCDADLGPSAADLGPLVAAIARGEGDLAIAAFTRRAGGGVGAAVGFARWALRRETGLELRAPVSGQRALTVAALAAVLPFAPRFGMELGMTIDAARVGLRVVEVPLDLEHRPSGRTIGGFAHRARQGLDFARAHAARRGR